MKKVSVIVPVYNLEKYIKDCLESLVNQTYKDVEIIVVNDGSKDSSQKIIDEYVKKYSNVKSFIKKNSGVSDTRNYGVNKATGEYIMFVDGDDYVDKEIVSKLYTEAVNKKLDIVTGDILKVYSDGRQEYYKCNQEYSDDSVKNYIIGDSGPCVKLIKKKIFDNVSFRTIAYEDLDIMPILTLYTNKIGYIKEALYYYRQVDGSATRLQQFNKKMLDIFDVLENLYNKLYDKYPDEIEYLYISHLLRTSTLRFLDFDGTNEYLDKIVSIMKDRFPNYQKNIYFTKSSKKLQILCKLAYSKQRWLIRIIKKISKK